MNKVKLLLSVTLLFTNSAFSYEEAEIKSKTLHIPAAEEKPNIEVFDEDKISTMQKQMHILLERIEMLEHNVSELKKQTAATSSSPVADAHSKASEPENIDANVNNETQEKKDYDAALIALKNKDYALSEEKFAYFIEHYPKSSKLSNAYFWYGEAFFKQNNFEKAAVNYLKGYKNFPKGEKAADSLLKLSLSLGSMKKTKEACIMLDKLDNEFKNRSESSIKRSKEAKNKYGCR